MVFIFTADDRFRGKGSISQRRGIFAAHFAAVKWHSCANGRFRSCETTGEMRVWRRKWEFLGVEDFVEHFAAAKLRGRGYEMALMCPEGVLQL